MPTYEYLCGCGVLFERYLRVSKRDDLQKCPDCGKMIGRKAPSCVRGFIHQEVSGAKPQNTGVSAVDAVPDRAIGQDAARRWEFIKGRVAKKRGVMHELGVPGELLSRTPDGEYDALSPTEHEIHGRAQAINNKAMDFLTREKKRSSEAQAG